MAFDDPIVFILLIFEILVAVVVVYLLYKLAQFLIKANRFMDEYMKRKESQEVKP